MDPGRFCRDEQGLVVSWLVRILVGIALVGIVLFDAGAIAVNFFTLDGTADEVAVEVTAEVAAGAPVTPNLQCDRRSRVPACVTAYRVAKDYDVRVVSASYDQEGVFHVTLRRTAETLIVGRINAIEDWAKASASARAATN